MSFSWNRTLWNIYSSCCAIFFVLQPCRALQSHSTEKRNPDLIWLFHFCYENTMGYFLFPQKLVGIYLGSFVSASGLFFILDLSVYYRKCSSSFPWLWSLSLFSSVQINVSLYSNSRLDDQNSSHLSTFCRPKSWGVHFQDGTRGQSRSAASLCCGTRNSTKLEVMQLCRILLNAPWHCASKSSKSQVSRSWALQMMSLSTSTKKILFYLFVYNTF